jgi:hypothetical protein
MLQQLSHHCLNACLVTRRNLVQIQTGYLRTQRTRQSAYLPIVPC